MLIDNKIIAVIAVSAVLFLAPLLAEAEDSKNYFSVKGGIFSPEELENGNSDSGFAGELAVGRYFTPYFACEGALGYFEYGFTYDRREFDVSVVPVTLNFKGVNRGENFSLEVGIGVGAYFESLNSSIVNDDEVVFGINLMLGLQFDITDRTFFALEWKPVFLSDAEFNDQDAFARINDFNGTTYLAALGYRF